MTDLALEWMSFRRSGKIADLSEDLIGAASARRLVDNLVTLGHIESDRSGWLADCAARARRVDVRQ